MPHPDTINFFPKSPSNKEFSRVGVIVINFQYKPTDCLR